MFSSLSNTKTKHTVNNLLYLFLSFPLGLLYFVFLVTGLSVGISTIIVWVGIPILLLTLTGIWMMTDLERALARHLLHIEIPQPRYREKIGSWKQWFVARIGDSLTWRGMIYLIVKFPLGILSFCLVITLPLVALALMFEPVIYILQLNLNMILEHYSVHSYSYMPFFVEIDGGNFDFVMFIRSFIGTPIGILLWIFSLRLLNGLANALGQFARVMLTPDQKEQSAAQAGATSGRATSAPYAPQARPSYSQPDYTGYHENVEQQYREGYNTHERMEQPQAVYQEMLQPPMY